MVESVKAFERWSLNVKIPSFQRKMAQHNWVLKIQDPRLPLFPVSGSEIMTQWLRTWAASIRHTNKFTLLRSIMTVFPEPRKILIWGFLKQGCLLRITPVGACCKCKFINTFQTSWIGTYSYGAQVSRFLTSPPSWDSHLFNKNEFNNNSGQIKKQCIL